MQSTMSHQQASRFGKSSLSGGNLNVRSRIQSRNSSRAPISTVALIGGGGRGGGGAQGGRGGRGGLIMPGGGRGPPRQDGPGQGIIDPSQQRPGGGGGGLGLAGEGLQMPGQEVAPTYNKYRPPPGFAQDEEGQAEAWTDLDKQLKQMDANQLLEMLNCRGGYWHTLAKVIPILNREGFDGKLLEDMTGIDTRQQNLWSMAGAVYDSLIVSGEIDQKKASYFDHMEDGPTMLSEFRFASADELRGEAANYIVDNSLEAEDAKRLAWAVKDFERRSPEEKESFEYTPADCLALKYFRDAVEQAKDEELASRALKTAMAINGVSASAMARMERLRETGKASEAEIAEEERKLALPMFEYARMTEDEAGFRPVACVGTYGQADSGAVASASVTKTSTEFGFFSETGAGHKWMVLPAWRAVAFIKQPYILHVTEVTDVPPLVKDQKGAEDHEIQREGPAVILVDRAVQTVQEDKWYILPGATGAVEMVPGPQVGGSEHLGEVQLIVKPPRRGAQDNDTVPVTF